MNVQITQEKENKLFGRTELEARVQGFQATPNRKDLRTEIAKLKACGVDCVVIDKVEQDFGAQTATVAARVYPSADKAKAVEPGYKFKREEPKKKVKKG